MAGVAGPLKISTWYLNPCSNTQGTIGFSPVWWLKYYDLQLS
jgi:hypothetical protein